MARLVLVGLPGAGKTTVAGVIATRWGCECADTDDEIAATVGGVASQYLRREGEAKFRERELEALRAALERDAVVATGGGAVTMEAARTMLRDEVVVWLDCPDPVLLERMGDVDRPLLDGDPETALARLREERTRFFADVARARVDASGAVTSDLTLSLFQPSWVNRKAGVLFISTTRCSENAMSSAVTDAPLSNFWLGRSLKV